MIFPPFRLDPLPSSRGLGIATRASSSENLALDVNHLQVGDTDFAIDPARNPVLAEKYLRWNEAETYFPRAAV